MSPIRAADPNPTHGRFLSVDPIMDLTDPAQWHPYTYANNNPTTYSDPTGLAPMIDGQWGSPQAAAKAPSSKRLPTIKDETGGYTPAGYSPRPSRDDRPGGPGTPWVHEPPTPPVVPITQTLPPSLEHFHGISFEDIIAAIMEALEEQAVESDPIVVRGPDTYWKIEVKACALVCAVVGIGWDKDFDFTLGGGAGADVGISVSAGGGIGENQGLGITPTCTVATPIGGVYGEVGLGEETTFFGGGGYSWGADAGCSVEVTYTW